MHAHRPRARNAIAYEEHRFLSVGAGDGDGGVGPPASDGDILDRAMRADHGHAGHAVVAQLAAGYRQLRAAKAEHAVFAPPHARALDAKLRRAGIEGRSPEAFVGAPDDARVGSAGRLQSGKRGAAHHDVLEESAGAVQHHCAASRGLQHDAARLQAASIEIDAAAVASAADVRNRAGHELDLRAAANDARLGTSAQIDLL